MRNPDRIPRIIQKLQQLWTKHPYLRLGQLLTTAADVQNPSLYYMEDEELEAMIETSGERIL